MEGESLVSAGSTHTMQVKKLRLLSSLSFIVLCGLLSLDNGNVHAAEGVAQLDTEIGVLQATTSATVAAFARIEADTNLNVGGLVNGGVVPASPSSMVSWPIYLISSTFTITGVQVDIVVPSSFTIVSVTAGSSALDAGKSVSTAMVNGLERVIVFGLNQTPILSGPIAIAQVQVGNVPKSFCSFPLINPVGTDANGNTVLMSSESGTIEVN